MLIRFLFLTFGFAFALRTIKNQTSMKSLSEATSKNITTSLILYFWLMTILSPWMTVPVLGILLFVPNLAALRLEWILNLILKRLFREKVIQFFDELVLQMMTGKSFRDSFLLLTSNSRDFFQIKMREILHCPIDLKSHPDSLRSELLEMAELVQSVEKSPHKALDRIQNFRRQLKWKQSFRKKSRQATIQIRAQASILSCLYLLLLIYTIIVQETWSVPLHTLSISLFLIGLSLLFILGRNPKWKT